LVKNIILELEKSSFRTILIFLTIHWVLIIVSKI
jgi:hypothetical protein